MRHSSRGCARDNLETAVKLVRRRERGESEIGQRSISLCREALTVHLVFLMFHTVQSDHVSGGRKITAGPKLC